MCSDLTEPTVSESDEVVSLPTAPSNADSASHTTQCLWFLSQTVLNSLSRRWARLQQPPLSAMNNVRKQNRYMCFFIFPLEINCMLARPSLLMSLFHIGKGRHFKINVFNEGFYFEFSSLRQHAFLRCNDSGSRMSWQLLWQLMSIAVTGPHWGRFSYSPHC